MKINFNIFKKKAVRGSLPNKESSSSSFKNLGWMTTDPRKQKEQAVEAQAAQQRGFIPEMWLKDGESKLVRFRHHAGEAGCIASFWTYSFMTKDKRYHKVTQPEEGEPDLFADEGLRPSLCFLYEVIDINGFKDRNQKKIRNAPRFLRANNKMHEQLKRIAMKKGGRLDEQDIEITRFGSKAATTYMFEPQDKEPMSFDMKKAEKLSPKVPDLFKPPTESEQRSLLSRMVPRDND